jgi:iturin family lipopeptide synthetase B
MIPSYFIKIENIPLTGNGKLNVKALPDPQIKLQDTKIFLSPSNEIEEHLRDIWSDILGLDKNEISIDDDFFELGGHSLKAIRLISRINKKFNTNYDLKSVFVESTIVKIASKLNIDNWLKEKEHDTDFYEIKI